MSKKIKVIDKFSNILKHLKTHRGLYVPSNEYGPLIHFIDGYLIALRDMSNYDLFTDIQCWLAKKVNRSFAAHWAWYILHMSNNDEQVANKKIFDFLEEFIQNKKQELQIKKQSNNKYLCKENSS